MPLNEAARTNEQVAEFVMAFVAHSDEMRDEYMDMFTESMKNYLVQPEYNGSIKDKDYPLGRNNDNRPMSGFSILKDSESHQVVETLLGGTLLTLFGDPGFIQTRRRGVENTFKASAASRLLEYSLELEDTFRTFYQWLKDGFIFGTGVLQGSWEFLEEPFAIQREFQIIGGQEVPVEFRGPLTTYDDIRMQNVDLLKFYPSPGQPLLSRMVGCAKQFEMTANAAMRKAANTPGWSEEKVKEAIDAGTGTKYTFNNEDEDMVALEGFDRPQHRKELPQFRPMEGYEYWGEVPWKVKAGEDQWKVFTVLNGVTVAKRDWPLMRRRLPFYDFTVNPMTNRFYGLSPLEVSRYTQDFLDTMLSCLADATVRMTHPPWLVHRNSDIDKAKLMAYHPNIPLETDMMEGVKLVDYDPKLQIPAAIAEQQRQSMRQRTGATDVEQGGSFGTKRLSASEASIQAQRSGIRPEAIATMTERQSLPAVGKGIISLYQQFLFDTPDLRGRIGEQPPAFMFELMGEHDVKFIGSRQQHNQQTRVEALERAATVIGQLPVAPMFPWAEFLVRYLRNLDLHELEAAVADPEQMLLHSTLAQLQQGGGAPAANGNGIAEQLSPSGLLPAQAAGGSQVA